MIVKNRPVYVFSETECVLYGITGVFTDCNRKIIYFTFDENDTGHKGFNEVALKNILKKYKGYKLKVLEKDGNFLTDYYNADISESNFLEPCMEDRIDINFK